MNKFIRFSVVCLVVALITGSYFIGKIQGDKQGYDKGYAVGKSEAVDQLADKSYSEKIKIEGEYNALVADYNSLLKDYETLAKTPVVTYQPRTPVTCNTYNYDLLNSSTTTCY